jgi:multidrug efflux pump subunit AcrA (membrane-fusion protein)
VKLRKPRLAGIVLAGVALLVAGGLYLRFGRATAVALVEARSAAVTQRVVGPGTVQARVPVTLAARWPSTSALGSTSTSTRATRSAR